jgi:1,4-alpha-glucan branching enzyme
MLKGYLSLILHAHLPFVRHPDKEDELAEEWLFEAITESYIPLLNMMQRLIREGVDYRLTINISPPLAIMLRDKLLQEKYINHLEKLIELSEKEVKRTINEPEFNKLARMYNYLYKESYYIFHEKYRDNILEGFKEVQDSGKLEIITSAATHGYLPLIFTEEAINAQINTGVKTYETIFGKMPEGIWLPECAFKPVLDRILAKNNIRYFITASHGILYASPRPRYGFYAPIYTPEGIAAFGRDIESSKQVWSADEGYPGDYNYREFYRDIGFDLDYKYIKPYLKAGIRKQVGIKYYKITGREDYKEVYNPEKAREKAAEHAGNFLFNRQQQIKYLNQILDRKAIIISPYDAELFGHWWFEGPIWLEYLLKKIHFDQDELKTITPSEYLKEYPKNQVSMPTESSWGYKGYHEVWLNGSNDWIYRHLHQAELEIISLARKFRNIQDKNSIYYRALNQAARELLLAQSSDWAFIMKTGTMVEYAVMRTKTHLNNFFEIKKQIDNNQINREFLNKLEKKNNIFSFIDFKIYQEEISKRGLLRKEG